MIDENNECSIQIAADHDPSMFQKRCDELTHDGYILSASDCSVEYTQGEHNAFYNAIFVKHFSKKQLKSDLT